VFPVTKVDKTLDLYDKDYQPWSEQDKTNWEQYDPEVQQGTPVGLQLVGRRHQEEKILGLVELLSTALAVQKKCS